MKNPQTRNPVDMKTATFPFLLTFLFLASSLWGDYSDRMKSRLSDVVAQKDAGTIGEGMDGFLHMKNSSNSAVIALVKAENNDRRELFKVLATKTGGDSSAVAKKFFEGIATKAKAGHWFRKISGKWMQK